MRIQIYTMQSVHEARAVIAQGVDHIGITPSACGLPGEIGLEAGRSIAESVRGFAACVALSVESDVDKILSMVHSVQPDILHLCGLENTLPPDAVWQLRDRLPTDVAIMQAVSIAGPEAIDVALAYHEVADYLILDTQAPDIAGIGASGAVHDWSISREIVKRVHVPVILAGGLSPDNVAEAIRTVRPWGVDSLTHTNKPLPGGGFCKDLNQVRAFARNARLGSNPSS